jgi:hypothetical protein
MARRKTDPTTAPELPLTGGKREPIGTVERAAAADVRELRRLELVGSGVTALEAAYRRAAKEIDRAGRARDVWAGLAAIRELRATRLELGPVVNPMSGDDVDDLLEQVAAMLRAQR